MAEIFYIPIDKLHPHPNNPRADVGDVTELAESIRAKGVLQNLTVVPMALADPKAQPSEAGHYTILIGHRRCAAAKLAGLKEVPCSIVDMDEKEQLQTMLIENIQRSDLTPFEQAQGFQMMLDLGCTVQEISEKSGFSASTVRRRVKMAELDKAKLKEVSGRQLNLEDFDTLAQIEDISERNKCLDAIGTSDFNLKVKAALNKQACRKNLPAVKSWLEEIGAKEIPVEDSWSNKYESIGSYFYVSKWGEQEPPNTDGEKIYYSMTQDYFRLFRKRKKAEPVKKTDEQIEREKKINEVWERCQKLAADAYELRKDFISKLSMNTKNQHDVLYGSLISGVFRMISYITPDTEFLSSAFGIDMHVYTEDRLGKFAGNLDKITNENTTSIVYSLWGDSEGEMCVKYRRRDTFPEYELNIKLNLLYDWLVKLGYEMSTEEMAMLNGEHEIYGYGDN